MIDRARLRPVLPSLLLALVASLAFAYLGTLRGMAGRASGDEGTFLAMTASVALDGDLLFGAADRARIEAASGGYRSVILQRAADGRLSYSKPSLFALVAAPFYRLAGEAGVLAVNALLLLAALWLAFHELRRRAPAGAAAFAVVGFAGASVVPAYVGWGISETLQVALALAGLTLALGGARAARRDPAGRTGRWLASGAAAPWVGGALLGLLTFTRYPNGLVVAAAVAAALALGRWRRAAKVGLSAALAFVAVTGLNVALTGVAVPYKAVRSSFDHRTGYPQPEARAEATLERFRAKPATHRLGVRPRLEPVTSAYSSLYFLVGRHTGMLVYFPAALVFLLAALRWRDPPGLVLLAFFLAGVVFYLVWMPRNYFGGEGFVGNRYLLSLYPLLLRAPLRPPRARGLAAAWLVAAAAWGSAVVSVTGSAHLDRTSQSHVHAGLFRWLPYESTAPGIDGRTDRYWSDEFLRFVDPWANVGEWSFRLSSERPAAELLVANQRPHGAMRFVIHADVPEVELVYRDWRKETVRRLTSATGGVHGMVRFHPSPAWRRHPFWWRPGDPFPARVFRLSVRSPDGRPAHAELRYLGPYRPPARIFDARLLELELPAEAPAGAFQRIPLRVENASRRAWSSADVLPVYVAYRLFPLEPGAPGPIEGRRTPVPGTVEPGGVLATAMEVRWPERPGRYRVVVDLILEGIAWFADRAGEPLAEIEVEVVMPEAGR